MLTHLQLVERLAAAAAMGGAIGYERNRRGRPLDLRVHMLVALTAAMFMVISSQFAYYQHYASGEGIEVDGSRIAASVVSAVGFLAGGAILRTGAGVQGLTTAAGLWLVTAIGLGAGAGMYVESAAVTGLGLLSLTVLRRFEGAARPAAIKRRVSLLLTEEAPPVSQLAAALTELGAVVTEVEYEHRLDDKPRREVTLELTLPTALSVSGLIERIERHPGVRRVRVQSV
jgi:putative Mg2+ transporter-C (MgtC) family protein